MTAKASEYANFKTLRSYVISIFDWAEELEYIEANRVAKTLRRIKAVKKIQLAESKRDEDLYLTHEQLQEWFSAFKEDLENDKISLKDYVLFYLTFFLGDRKSETYALQWKHIDFSKSQIQALTNFLIEMCFCVLSVVYLCWNSGASHHDCYAYCCWQPLGQRITAKEGVH